jgi:hypothetical protein
MAIFIFLRRSPGIMQSANLISRLIQNGYVYLSEPRARNYAKCKFNFDIYANSHPKSRIYTALARSMRRSGAICIELVSFRTIFANYSLVLVAGGDLSCDNLNFDLVNRMR